MDRVFCVEDDENIRELVAFALKSTGFESNTFESGEELFVELQHTTPDIILLDIMLPGEDGITILKRLKGSSKTEAVPVIMLTAKSTEYDKVKGLDLGADDYITKPFGVMELISRIKAVLRRGTPKKTDEIIALKDLSLNEKSRVVTFKEQEITLTFKEFELLLYLLRNKGTVLSRDMIMEKVWGFDFEGESRTVDMHIKTLRQKLGEGSALIETVRGVGYRIGG